MEDEKLMYLPTLVEGGFLVDAFHPKHRAARVQPVRDFRFAGRIYINEQHWRRVPPGPPKHRL